MQPNAMLEQTEVTHQAEFFLMGKPLRFETNDPVLLAVAEEAFGRYPAPETRDPGAPLVLRMLVHDGSSGRSLLEVPAPRYRTQGHLFYITAGEDNVAVADLNSGFAFGFFTGALAHNRPRVRYIFMEGLALSMLQVRHNFVGLHAACVVKDGLSLLFQGAAGQGKSTLAYACIRRGFQMLGEDAVLVECGPAGYRLWGNPWKIHLLPDTRSFFPELEAEAPRLQINQEWKLEFNPETYYPGSTTMVSEPGLVLFLERAAEQGPALIEPMSLEAAMDRLEIVWPWSVGWTEAMEALDLRLLEGRAYRLLMNGSPDETAAQLADFLARWDPGSDA